MTMKHIFKPGTRITTGERAGSATAVDLPDVPCYIVNIKAVNSNAGNCYIGSSAATVTAVDGTTDVTSGLELAAGEETGWIPCNNLNELSMICDNAGDDITYMAIERPTSQ